MNDWGIVISTLIAPLLAVQATRWLDRRRAKSDEQRRLFTTLMATRGRYTDVRHAESLNVVDIVFAGEGKSLKAVRSAFREYMRHLETTGAPDSVWVPRRNDLFVALLYEMAKHLGLEFDRTTIASQAFYPAWWNTVEMDQAKIRSGLAQIMDGRAALPVLVHPATTGTAPPAPSASANVNAGIVTSGTGR